MTINLRYLMKELLHLQLLTESETVIFYNYSDWFNLGLTSDLKIWGNAKIDDDDINYFTRYSSKKYIW